MENDPRVGSDFQYPPLTQIVTFVALFLAVVPWILVGPLSVMYWVPAFALGVFSLVAIRLGKPERRRYAAASIAVLISGAGVLFTLVTSPATFFGPAAYPVHGGRCANNLHQLGLAIGSHTHYHKGLYPDPDKWPQQLLEYTKTWGVFICPVRTSRGLPRYPTKQGERLATTYSMNERLKGLSVRDIRKPEETVLLFESTGEKLCGGPELLPKETRHEETRYLVLHDPYVNVLFADWHVNKVPLDEVRSLKWDPK